MKLLICLLMVLLLVGCGTPRAIVELTPKDDGGAIITIEGKASASLTTTSGLAGTVDNTSGETSIFGQIFGSIFGRDMVDNATEIVTLKAITD